VTWIDLEKPPFRPYIQQLKIFSSLFFETLGFTQLTNRTLKSMRNKIAYLLTSLNVSFRNTPAPLNSKAWGYTIWILTSISIYSLCLIFSSAFCKLKTFGFIFLSVNNNRKFMCANMKFSCCDRFETLFSFNFIYSIWLDIPLAYFKYFF